MQKYWPDYILIWSRGCRGISRWIAIITTKENLPVQLSTFCHCLAFLALSQDKLLLTA